MEIKVLGTVSPTCKGTKNCPGYLVNTGNKKILLDCGNGITREINEEEDLEDLTIIISHLHRDHYGDLLILGYSAYVYHNLGYLNKRIKVYLPSPNYIDGREKYIASDGWSCSRPIKKVISDYEFLHNLGEEQYFELITYDEKTNLRIDNVDISFCKNPHQINTYSIKLTSKEGTIIYSSDTGYKNNTLEKFAKKADILICESSYIRGQHRKNDNHLYAYEAGKIAKAADVEKLVLTHFWPTIDKKLYQQEAIQEFKNTEVAEEGKIYRLERRTPNGNI